MFTFTLSNIAHYDINTTVNAYQMTQTWSGQLGQLNWVRSKGQISNHILIPGCVTYDHVILTTR